ASCSGQLLRAGCAVAGCRLGTCPALLLCSQRQQGWAALGTALGTASMAWAPRVLAQGDRSPQLMGSFCFLSLQPGSLSKALKALREQHFCHISPAQALLCAHRHKESVPGTSLSRPRSEQGEGALAQALALGDTGMLPGGPCPPVPPPKAPAPVPVSGSGVDLGKWITRPLTNVGSPMGDEAGAVNEAPPETGALAELPLPVCPL
ncbi:unnamed protein product, partial [Coccothraustes coccothraustes]